jgi:hypothetical protein
MYFRHPGPALNRLFDLKPFQGAVPEDARFIFLGLDANYDPTIEESAVFPKVLEYFEDGVQFWRKHGVHHPFLLPEYRGDGRFYHKTFSRIGFTPVHASDVCFIELLHVPTYGRSALAPTDLDRAHLRRIGNAILGGASRSIFIPGGVARLMRASGEFPWMPKAPKADGDSLSLWLRSGPKTIYSHLHFSVYGRFEQQKSAELQVIRALIPTAS